MIEAQSIEPAALSKHYGYTAAMDAVGLNVRTGACCCRLGPSEGIGDCGVAR
ncbi:MAG: hypothetical protein HUJ24_10905 [Rhodobacteraceae bacterium]|nr:hypothetical protein [Paracoccaceae bacterium]